MSDVIGLLYKRIDALVSANPCMKLQELARSFGIDRRKIEGAIRERGGCGFQELKNQARLNIIIALLAEESPHTSIKEIAYGIGVTPNALSRFIRTMTGCCARELRCNKGQNTGGMQRSAMQQTCPALISQQKTIHIKEGIRHNALYDWY